MYVHRGYSSVYEKDRKPQIENGCLISKEEIDNREVYKKLSEIQNSNPEKPQSKTVISSGPLTISPDSIRLSFFSTPAIREIFLPIRAVFVRSDAGYHT